MIYFHGKQSGSTMSFRKPDGTSAGDITGVRHVFCVTRIVEAWGYALGSSKGSAQMYFCPGSMSGAVGSTVNILAELNTSPYTMGGACFLDGQAANLMTEPTTPGLRVLEWSGLGAMTVDIGAIFRDRTVGAGSNKRSGGDDIGEVVLFTNNLTTAEHPLGLFHPHEPYHHIKKENIGLIEVLGLAVLPSRLKTELARVKELVLSGGDLRADELTAKHADWIDALRAEGKLHAETIDEDLRREVGAVFLQVLTCCGVFKRDAAGQAAFSRFLAAAGAQS